MNAPSKPNCKCHGEPMQWHSSTVRNGWWECVVKMKARHRKYRASNPPAIRQNNDRNNPRRLRAGNMYLGMSGFTKAEREAIVNGTFE